MTNQSDTHFTFNEELANSISHGFGILFGIVSIPLLIAMAVSKGEVGGIIGSSIYGFSFLMVFTFSTLYHGFQEPKVKRVFKILDHISIYFLIAGSYTPFILTHVYNSTGISLLFVLWGLTLLGIVFKIWFTGKFNLLSTAIYLIMGWMLLFVAKTFFINLPMPIILLIAIGGGLYSIGVVFYLWEKFRYHHAVWHIFVLAAGICHYVAILLAVS